MQLRYLPNFISCLRILLIIPVLWTLMIGYYAFTFYLFLIAGISDGLDGLLARLFGWTSHFGAFIDPVADKLLLISSIFALAWLGHLAYWLAILMIARDLWIIGGALSYQYWIGPLEFKPVLMSKLNTFFQIILILFILMKLSGIVHFPEKLLSIVTAAVFISTVISFIQYTVEWTKRAIRNYKPLSSYR